MTAMLVSLIGLTLLVGSCGFDDDKTDKKGSGQRSGPKVDDPKVDDPKVDDPKVDDPKVDDPRIVTPTPQKDKPVFVETAEYVKFKDQFNTKFTGSKTIDPQVLYQIIEAVPSQTTPWSCGLVQSKMAEAAAYIKAGVPLDKAGLAKCNIVEDYPLLLDLEIPNEKNFQSLVKLIARTIGITLPDEVHLEEVGGKKYFRVGAAPSNLPNYLQTKLPKGISAHHIKGDSLSAKEFLAILDKAIEVNIPLLALYVISAADFRLHYYSVVGYLDDGKTLLVLDTTGSGNDRIKTFAINDFIANMDASDLRKTLDIFANVRKNAMLMALAKPLIKGELPDESALEGFGNFNLIAFSNK